MRIFEIQQSFTPSPSQSAWIAVGSGPGLGVGLGPGPGTGPGLGPGPGCGGVPPPGPLVTAPCTADSCAGTAQPQMIARRTDIHLSLLDMAPEESKRHSTRQRRDLARRAARDRPGSPTRVQ